MPKYYCDYCDIYLTHDSPSVRKSHNDGWKHKAQVKAYYSQFLEDETQTLIDQKIKEYEFRQRLPPGAGMAFFPPPPLIFPVGFPVPGAGPPPHMGMGMPFGNIHAGGKREREYIEEEEDDDIEYREEKKRRTKRQNN